MTEERIKNRTDQEIKAIGNSIAGYLFMAFLGVGFALYTGSEAILLDGVYSLVSFVMAILARRVAKIVEQPDDRDYQFGFAKFEPMLNAIRGLIILALCVLALVSAVMALLGEGRPLSAGIAVFYGALAATGCILIAAIQNRKAKIIGSPLLSVDAKNWLVDGVVSTGAGLAFAVAYFLEGTSHQNLVPYIDPMLVTLMVLFLIRVPLSTLKENLHELLQGAPERDINQKVRDRFNQAAHDLNLADSRVRLTKVGRYLYLMAHLVLADNAPQLSVAQADQTRKRISRAMAGLHSRLVMDIIFTRQKDYTQGVFPNTPEKENTPDTKGDKAT